MAIFTSLRAQNPSWLFKTVMASLTVSRWQGQKIGLLPKVALVSGLYVVGPTPAHPKATALL